VKLDYITVSTLLLGLVAKHLLKHQELVSVNLSWLQSCVLLPCLYDIEASYRTGL